MWQLRCAWRRPYRHERRVTVILQEGRRRRRIEGTVAAVATSGAFVLLDVDTPADTSAGERDRDPLHVPTDRIREVLRHDRR